MVKYLRSKPATAEDRISIQHVIEAERYWRDRREWDLQLQCYADDCVISAGWFQGSAAEFVAQSRLQAKNPALISGSHYFMPASIRVHGERAITESATQVMVRALINDVEVDMTGITRAYSRLRRTNKGWKIASLHGIYQKDMLCPAQPGQTILIQPGELEAFRASYRMNSWIMMKLGVPASQDMLGDDRPEELAAFYQLAEDWLSGGA